MRQPSATRLARKGSLINGAAAVTFSVVPIRSAPSTTSIRCGPSDRGSSRARVKCPSASTLARPRDAPSARIETAAPARPTPERTAPPLRSKSSERMRKVPGPANTRAPAPALSCATRPSGVTARYPSACMVRPFSIAATPNRRTDPPAGSRARQSPLGSLIADTSAPAGEASLTLEEGGETPRRASSPPGCRVTPVTWGGSR